MALVSIFSQIKLLFGPLVMQLVWYVLEQLFTSVSLKVVDIYVAASRLGEYPPLFTSTSVNNCELFIILQMQASGISQQILRQHQSHSPLLSRLRG